MNTENFPLNMQSGSTLSKFWNFGGGVGLKTLTPILVSQWLWDFRLNIDVIETQQLILFSLLLTYM